MWKGKKAYNVAYQNAIRPQVIFFFSHYNTNIQSVVMYHFKLIFFTCFNKFYSPIFSLIIIYLQNKRYETTNPSCFGLVVKGFQLEFLSCISSSINYLAVFQIDLTVRTYFARLLRIIFGCRDVIKKIKIKKLWTYERQLEKMKKRQWLSKWLWDNQHWSPPIFTNNKVHSCFRIFVFLVVVLPETIKNWIYKCL